MQNNKWIIALTLGLGLGLTLALLWLVIGQTDTAWADPGIRYVSPKGNNSKQCDNIADRCRTVHWPGLSAHRYEKLLIDET
jgi:hypothetical protein